MTDNFPSTLKSTTAYQPLISYPRGMAPSFLERKVLLVLIDLFALSVGQALFFAVIPKHNIMASLSIQYLLPLLFLDVLWLFFSHTFDAYDVQVAESLSRSMLPVIEATIATWIAYSFFLFLPPIPLLSRTLVAASFLFAMVFLLMGRVFYSIILSKPVFRHRALIVGTGWTAQAIAEVLLKYGKSAYTLVGFVDDSWDEHNVAFHTPHTAYRVLGPYHSLVGLVLRHRIDTLVLATGNAFDEKLLKSLAECLELGVEIIPMSLLYEKLTGRIPLEHIAHDWYIVMPVNHPLTRPFNRLIKRGMDIVLASLGILLLLPFVPLIALAIYLDSPGPIFYTQWRVGKGGRLFKAYKFRSMVPDAEKGRPVWARENDPRVTRVGRILRKTHVDEFPQFLNILKGEMSAVGPRPERPEFVAELAREIPFYRVRHAIKPGMAGWALVKYGYASSKEDATIKLEYDLYYIRHWSPWFDLIILAKTVIDTITFGGR